MARASEEPDYVRAEAHAAGHRQEIEQSRLCGCYYCLAMFAPAAIDEWLSEVDAPLCPECGTDAVIGDASGFAVSRDFLQLMQVYWF